MNMHVSRRADNTELTEALDKIDIEAWLDREGVEYKLNRGSRGMQANVKECPCCGNDNWKVYIGLDTGLGNCFHGDCEEKFNKWKFISKTLGTPARDVIEHIKQVAREQGWRPPRTKGVAVNTATELKMPESIALPHGGRNLKYLDNRGITGAIASYFELRFSHTGSFRYIDEEGRPRTQSYANRIIIPVFDLEGELVSFQGRDITGEAEKKYLFPPGFASTGTHLYNGHNAWGAEHIVAGEGVFDVAAIKIALDEDMSLRDIVAVGTFGKHLSHGDEGSQLAKLMALKKRGLKIVTLMWDAEKAAIKAMVETAKLIKSCGLVARVALLPKGCDPNETSAQEVRNAFYKAITITPAEATKLLILAERY